jgi:glutamate N-acetyltransferase/amino-acid N-acetyltransferase
MAKTTARLLRLPAEQVLVASTGRIGVTLPMANVKRGIAAAAGWLRASRESARHAVEAIMTSDTRPKEVAVEFEMGGRPVRMGGICKGAGMIQPGMSATGARPAASPRSGGLHATMLGFITTDANIEASALRSALAEAVANSFNRITVDGDMSTNDTVLVLANGMAGNAKIRARGKAFAQFEQALSYVCGELAKMIVRDGEGATRFVTVRVSGAKTYADADAAARAVANSSLVKTSWFGGDPNWGRILAALGYSAAEVVEARIDVGYSAPGSKQVLSALKSGQPTKTSFAALCKLVAEKDFDLHINLNLGKAGAVMHASDLTEEYVAFNKGEVGDPASMGG